MTECGPAEGGKGGAANSSGDLCFVQSADRRGGIYRTSRTQPRGGRSARVWCRIMDAGWRIQRRESPLMSTACGVYCRRPTNEYMLVAFAILFILLPLSLSACRSPAPAGQPTATAASQATANPRALAEYRVQWIGSQVPVSMPVASDQVIAVTMKNTSNTIWPAKAVADKDAVFVSYHWRLNGSFVDNYDGVRTELPHDIVPGEQITVANVHIVTPNKPGAYQLELTLVQENVAWFETRGADMIANPVNVS